MILSSSDILRVIGADAIIRQEANLAIVEVRPGIGTDDVVYIYIEKYPTVEDFEATWKIWVQDNSGMGKYVLDAMTSLLPNFEFRGEHYTTTDFASERTVVKTETEKELEATRAERGQLQSRFSGLQKELESRLSMVRDGIDGRDGKDGLDGRDGKDGRDGRDMVATDASLFDLQDVEQGIAQEKGQVLTWDGVKWTNLFIPQVLSSGHGGGSGGIVEEAPQDGNYYVRQNSAWVPNTSVPVDISNNTLDELSDVNVPTPAAGEALIYNGSEWASGGDFSGGSF